MLQGIKLATKSEEIKKILQLSRTIAVVGSSPSPDRDSNHITQFLNLKGYKIFPVNPNYQEILGLKCYPRLQDIPEAIEIVDVFIRPENILPIVKDSVACKAKTIWFQLGVSTPEAVEYALQNQLTVVDNKCIMVEHRRLIE
jgi:predicted CoA-binding protein